MLAWVLGIFLLWGGPTHADSVTQVSSDSTVDRMLHVDRVIIIGNKVTKSLVYGNGT